MTVRILMSPVCVSVSCGPDQLLKFWSCFDIGKKSRKRSCMDDDDGSDNDDPLARQSILMRKRFPFKRRASLPVVHSPLLGKGLR